MTEQRVGLVFSCGALLVVVGVAVIGAVVAGTEVASEGEVEAEASGFGDVSKSWWSSVAANVVISSLYLMLALVVCGKSDADVPAASVWLLGSVGGVEVTTPSDVTPLVSVVVARVATDDARAFSLVTPFVDAVEDVDGFTVVERSTSKGEEEMSVVASTQLVVTMRVSSLGEDGKRDAVVGDDGGTDVSTRCILTFLRGETVVAPTAGVAVVVVLLVSSDDCSELATCSRRFDLQNFTSAKTKTDQIMLSRY